MRSPLPARRHMALLALGIVAASAASAVDAASGHSPGVRELDYTAQPFQVFLTGFLGFLNFSSNPTSDIARILGGTCKDIDIVPDPSQTAGSQVKARLRVCFRSEVLPVNETGALWPTQHLRDAARRSGRIPYDAVMHCGLEDGAKGLKIEVAAVNIKANDTGDDGTLPAVPGAPHLLATTVNIGWLALNKDNFRVHKRAPAKHVEHLELWSRDAGKYYCNEMYYRTLEYIRTEAVSASTGALLPAVFIHVQNATQCKPEDDAANIRQIAAHLLWATYIAPGLERHGAPMVLAKLSPQAVPPAAAASPGASVVGALAGAVIGGLLTAAALLGPAGSGLRAAHSSARGLRAPLRSVAEAGAA